MMNATQFIKRMFKGDQPKLTPWQEESLKQLQQSGTAHIRVDMAKGDDISVNAIKREPPAAPSIEQLTKVAELNAAAQIRIMLLDKIGNEETTYTEVDDLICDWIHERMNRGPKVDY